MRRIPEGLHELLDCDQSQQLLALNTLLKGKMAQWMLIGSSLPCPMAPVEGLTPLAKAGKREQAEGQQHVWLDCLKPPSLEQGMRQGPCWVAW